MKTYVKKVRGMGRGVFAAKRIKKGDVIEIAPMLIFDRDARKVGRTDIAYYYFSATRNRRGKYWGIALGNGSLYNHSQEPNANWSINRNKEIITFKSLRDIKKNEQVFVDYGYPKKYYKEFIT